QVTIKLYTTGITANTKAYFWSGLTQKWTLCSNQGPAGTGDYVYVVLSTATADTVTSPMTGDLSGTIFALVAAPAPPPVVTPPLSVKILSPTEGSTGVSIKPLFAWEDKGTAFYEFQLAIDPYFAGDLVSDSPKLQAPYFAYPAELEYSTTYYWRVRTSKASPTTICVGAECGAWAQGLFTTEAKPVPPVEPTPPVVIPPPPAQIVPGWIYAIVAIGAVLIIAVIILIVRTKRA
ncbi:MAG: hypothetical protein PHU08_05735, partial [Dehalococcoidales bacterium]|nr:hypothetical protein [Dehalococcoidales bacterium]